MGDKSITFRPEVLAYGYFPGEGQVDPRFDALMSIGKQIAAMPIDGTGLQKPATEAASSLGAARALSVEMRDGVEVQSSQLQGMLQRAVQNAISQVPTNTGMSFGAQTDYQAATGSARADATRAFMRDVSASVVEGARDKAVKVAQRAVKACTALSDAIEEARSDYDSPEKLTLEELGRVSQWENQIKTQDDAIAYASRKFAALVSAEKEVELWTFIPAALAVIKLTLETPEEKLVAIREARHNRLYTDMANGPHSRAKQLLKVIRTYKADNEPQSIGIADNILQQLRPVFSAIIGVPAGFIMSQQDRAALYYSDSAGRDRAKDWQVDPTWPFRGLPPGPEMPGWSRVLTKTVGGIAVREPAARR